MKLTQSGLNAKTFGCKVQGFQALSGGAARFERRSLVSHRSVAFRVSCRPNIAKPPSFIAHNRSAAFGIDGLDHGCCREVTAPTSRRSCALFSHAHRRGCCPPPCEATDMYTKRQRCLNTFCTSGLCSSSITRVSHLRLRRHVC